jgi:hypothetical protein
MVDQGRFGGLGRAIAVAGTCGVTLALAGAGGAAARPKAPFKIVAYKVTYEGSGTYSVKGVDGPAHNETTAHFHWNAHYNLLFIEKKGFQVTAITTPDSQGGGDWTISSDNGGGDVCSKSGGLKLNHDGEILGRVAASGAIPMRLTPGSNDYSTTGGSNGPQACDTSDFWQQWVESFSKVGTADQIDPLTAFLHLSRADLKFGKVIINVSNHTLAAPSLTVDHDCGSGDGATCTQSYEWHGSVTFRKTRAPGGH